MTSRSLASGRDFTVRVTELGPRGGARSEFELACRRVLLPVMRVDERARPVLGRADERPIEDAAHNGPRVDDDLLVLARAHTGATELYDWWVTERSARFRGSHDVTVVALSGERRPITAWAFTGCRLVALRYSPLDAVASDVLMETAEVTFDAVTQTSHH